ncbi:DUF1799 domain-containing protein [Rhodobacteraceae bacterium M382]|nr:DUF1799 domain-containing protein [Rhodobacteraceae bacterium M382]
MNLPALTAFLQVCTQWRSVVLPQGGVQWLGLDYSGARDGLALAGIDVDADLWDGVRIMEDAARQALNSG